MLCVRQAVSEPSIQSAYRFAWIAAANESLVTMNLPLLLGFIYPNYFCKNAITRTLTCSVGRPLARSVCLPLHLWRFPVCFSKRTHPPPSDSWISCWPDTGWPTVVDGKQCGWMCLYIFSFITGDERRQCDGGGNHIAQSTINFIAICFVAYCCSCSVLRMNLCLCVGVCSVQTLDSINLAMSVSDSTAYVLSLSLSLSLSLHIYRTFIYNEWNRKFMMKHFIYIF